MTGEKILIFGTFLAYWAISHCHGNAKPEAQDPGVTDFHRYKLMNEHGIQTNVRLLN